MGSCGWNFFRFTNTFSDSIDIKKRIVTDNRTANTYSSFQERNDLFLGVLLSFMNACHEQPLI